MDLCALDDGNDGEDNGVGFVEISLILATQNAFFFRLESFDRIYLVGLHCRRDPASYTLFTERKSRSQLTSNGERHILSMNRL